MLHKHLQIHHEVQTTLQDLMNSPTNTWISDFNENNNKKSSDTQKKEQIGLHQLSPVFCTQKVKRKMGN